MDISHWISHWADWDGDRIAVHFEGKDISYGEMDIRVSRLAAMLSFQLGVGKGDRVAYLGYNSPELLELLFSAKRTMGIMTRVVVTKYQINFPLGNIFFPVSFVKLINFDIS